MIGLVGACCKYSRRSCHMSTRWKFASALPLRICDYVLNFFDLANYHDEHWHTRSNRPLQRYSWPRSHPCWPGQWTSLLFSNKRNAGPANGKTTTVAKLSHFWNLLDEHARRLCLELNFGPLHLKSIRQQLSEFASSGLLMSHNALTSRFASSQQVEEAPPAISAVAIPTRNRTEALERSVDSYAACSREHGREI